MSAQYDLILNRNENFSLFIEYLSETDIPIDLLGPTGASDPTYYSKMMIKQYKKDTDAIVLLKSFPYEVLCGITSGISGGIKLNRNMGDTGGQTGGILINMNTFVSMALPVGKSFYDIFIISRPGASAGVSTKLLEGSIDIVQEITTNIEDQFKEYKFSDEIDGGAFS